MTLRDLQGVPLLTLFSLFFLPVVPTSGTGESGSCPSWKHRGQLPLRLFSEVCTASLIKRIGGFMKFWEPFRGMPFSLGDGLTLVGGGTILTASLEPYSLVFAPSLVVEYLSQRQQSRRRASGFGFYF